MGPTITTDYDFVRADASQSSATTIDSSALESSAASLTAEKTAEDAAHS